MKITLQNTTKIVKENGIDFRVWEGETESGVKIFARIPTFVAALPDQDLSQFERELQETVPPSAEIQAWPLRMVL